MRFLIPTILLALSIGSFVMYTNPTWQKVKDLKAQAAQYDTALTNSRKLQEQRDALDSKYRSLPPDQLARLQKLLPDNADNIRLIIDIQQMAQSYGMSVSSIKFNPVQATPGTDANGQKQQPTLSAASSTDIQQSTQDYGVFDMTFLTTATYPNFLKFIKDIESSLRLTDIESVEFTVDDASKSTLTYTVKLRTYWLKQ